MQNSKVEAGMNLTGIMTAPEEAKKTMEGAKKLTHPSEGGSNEIGENRLRYQLEADPVGTVPMPTNVKGLKSSMKEKMLQGDHIFIDKLGERLAFERTGTRLYEALMVKYQGEEDQSILPPLERLEQFFLEEMKHFHMLSEAMLIIGGDPTAMTPSADVTGMAGCGWIQVMGDPRTTFLQSLEIMLQAELVDTACWENLIALADSLGLNDLVEQFQIAYEEEEFHLMTVKDWVTQLTLNGKVVEIEEEWPH